MDQDRTHLVPYLLRQVRVGLVATGLIVVALGISYFVLDHEPFSRGGLAIVLGTATGGGCVIAALPWRRLLLLPRGMSLLYAWSVLDIVLISGAVAATGGDRSDLFLLYSLTTFFFVASYPPVAQVLLLALTAASYTVALAATGWDLSLGAYVARLSMLGVIAYLAGYLSKELIERAEAEASARDEANQRATLVSQVAEAGRDMTLDPSQVVDVAVDAAVGLGFADASFVALAEDGTASHVAASRGSFEAPAFEDDPVCRLAELVSREGGTVIGGERQDPTAVVPAASGAGLVASPVWAGGWLAAVLIGRMRGDASPARHEIEAFELLATHAGFALDNAGRYNEQRRTVERLEEADRLKSDFMTTVSHELRTPLTSILGHAATLELTWARLDEETRHDLLARLTSNARALDGKITHLLDFARLSSDSLTGGSFGVLDLSPVLRSAGEEAAQLLNRHRFDVAVADGLVTQGDAGLLSRIVGNLLNNAATHTPPGTAVTLEAHLENPSEIVVAVRDEGPGVPPGDLPYLGDRFYRAGDINVRPGGLGLGLALSNEILALHGSSLEVQSREGLGATFSFRLPNLGTPSSTPVPEPSDEIGSR